MNSDIQSFKNVNTLQAFWDPQMKVAKRTYVSQIYFNYKHSFMENKRMISLMATVNIDLIYINISDVQSTVKMEQ